MNRRWYNIAHDIITNNGHRIKRKCVDEYTYFGQYPLCLCQYIDMNAPLNHFCLNLHHKPFFSEFSVIDSFSNNLKNDLIASAIKNGQKYYLEMFHHDNDLPIDSIFLLSLIAKNDFEYGHIANAYYHKLQNSEDFNNPFCRIFSKSTSMNERFDDLQITRSESFHGHPIKHKVHNLYILNKKYRKFYVDPTDDVVLKALFCDILGFDETDFEILLSMSDNKGTYEDTHSVIALNLLEMNQCYPFKKRIKVAMHRVAKSILHRLKFDYLNGIGFGDLFFEQIVSLYWAGFGDHIKKEWILKIATHQNKRDYGYSHDYTLIENENDLIPIQQESTPHPTGLALLAMTYYEIGESKQSFYPIDQL